jgi:hypothetical protein
LREQTARIVANIEVLLQKGSFPGETAPALVEAQQFVAEFKAKLTEEIAKDGKSLRDAQDEAGLPSGDLPDRGRKSRKRNSK